MIRLTRNLQAISRRAGVFLAIVAGAGEPLVPRPEIVGVETADAHTLVLLVRDDASRPTPSQAPADYLVDDQPPAAVGRFSATIYEAKAEGRNDVFPQCVLHRLYLRLRTPLEEGHRYSIRTSLWTANWTFRRAPTGFRT